MSFCINAKDYVAYLEKAAAHIRESGDYISALDAATGDGDHWINLNMGLQALLEKKERLASLGLDECFREIGMTYMSVVGGSSGVLYGGAYVAASKTVAGQAAAGPEELCAVLLAMVEDMTRRGKSEPGYKTMIDAIFPAAQAFRRELGKGTETGELLALVRQAAIDGAEATRAMPAIRGRASYQTDKGVGHLDPGAVTMSFQIADLCDYIMENLLA